MFPNISEFSVRNSLINMIQLAIPETITKHRLYDRISVNEV